MQVNVDVLGYGSGAMDVSPFVRAGVFDPEIIQVMTGVYEELLDDLELASCNDAFTEIVAKEILRAARLGVHDVAEMHQRILGTLRQPQ